jgi:hypothetical protein
MKLDQYFKKQEKDEPPKDKGRDEDLLKEGSAISSPASQLVNGLLTGGAGSASASQTIRGSIPAGQSGLVGEEARVGDSMTQIIQVPPGPTVETEEIPAKRKKQEPVNPKWSDLSEVNKEVYVKSEELPLIFKPKPLSDLDIANAVNQRLSDLGKLEFLTKCWVPDKSYNFYPVYQKPHNRFPQWSWLDISPYLAFSHAEHGFYCIVCVLFGQKEVGKGGHQALGRFCDKAYRRFKDFKEDWKSHTNAKYHHEATINAEEFQKRMESGQTVRHEIDSGVKATVKKNRLMLSGILEVIRFCAINELPFRGHESGGLFNATLQLIAKAGHEGAKMVETAPDNAKYTSPQIQNELIECLAECLLEDVIRRVNDSPCFSILADETGLHEREFLTLCVRYLDANNLLREDFLGFVPIADTTGESVATAILERLRELRIDTRKLVGQGYDGAANMSGKIKGVQKRIQDLHPCADYYHCVNHNLNLALSDAAATLHIVRNLDAIQKLLVYLTGSAKRTEVLREMIKKHVPHSNRSSIAQLAPTRWVQRHETLIAFEELFPAVLAALKELDKDEKTNIASDLLNGLSSLSSVFSIVVARKMAGDLKFLAMILQAKNLDLLSAYKEIDAVRLVLESYLYPDKKIFNELFDRAASLCQRTNINDKMVKEMDTKKPGLVKDYMEKQIFRPYVEALITGIKDRFGQRQQVAFHLQLLLPSRSNELSMERSEVPSSSTRSSFLLLATSRARF